MVKGSALQITMMALLYQLLRWTQHKLHYVTAPVDVTVIARNRNGHAGNSFDRRQERGRGPQFLTDLQLQPLNKLSGIAENCRPAIEDA